VRDVKYTQTVPLWTVFTLSLACFAVAGFIDTATASAYSLTAGVLVVSGVYGIARVARAVSRPLLARLSLGLWLVFIAIAAVHAIGLTTVGAVVPAPTDGVVATVVGLTWATLVGACSTTTFLGLREYAASSQTTVVEDIVEQEYDYDY